MRENTAYGFGERHEAQLVDDEELAGASVSETVANVARRAPPPSR